MKKNKIYVMLQGRIGNQLFQYALARKIQTEKENAIIVMDDSRILNCGWENSLINYNLPNVEYSHKNIVGVNKLFTSQFFIRIIYKIITRKSSYNNKYKIEKKFNKLIGKMGMFICENGYMKPTINLNKPVYLEGFFQSEKYFIDIKEDIKKMFDSSQFPIVEQYTGINEIRERNSVCISVKVEHNVGSSLYSVCDIEYWKRAINYITENVDNPLFFICSDNVEYVINNLIDTSKFQYIVQDKEMPVHISLSVMAECKHFIIGNTTYGWWAQYLSNNKNKIVVAPSRWMAVDMPIDIYQDEWHLIEV